jgi:hypothetical protein
VEAEEPVAVEEGADEAVMAEVTAELMQESPRVELAESPEAVPAVLGPEAVVVLEAEAAARADLSARFCGLRVICPASSSPYR